MSKPTIAAVIIARDEEKNIVDAINSLTFADQIVVADTSSRDKTVEFARNAGAEVHEIPFDGFGAAKNRALEFCRADWIFSLDADERVSPELAQSILDAAGRDDGIDYYEFNRLTYFLGKPVRHSGWFPDYLVRFFKSGYRFSEKSVHESLDIDGRPGRLSGLLYHHSYESFEQYIEKLNLYTSINAGEMYRNGKRCGLISMLTHPCATFFKMYLAKGGFLDGSTGFMLAVLSSYHVFIKYAKLRHLSRNN